MVLLTSSAISVAISSGIVCTFTFLLFLSGYVLQQQTVRSLQEALRRPPEPRVIPTLPAAFQTAARPDNGWIPRATREADPADIDLVEVTVDAEENFQVEEIEDGQIQPGEQRDLILEAFQAPRIKQQRHPPAVVRKPGGAQTRLVRDHLQPVLGRPQNREAVSRHDDALQPSKLNNGDASSTVYSATHAYIVPLLHPTSLCTALLFSQTHRTQTILRAEDQPPIIFLYPSTWEMNPTPSTIAALNLLRTTIDSSTNLYSHIILHPVSISTIWSGPGMLESQILAEVQRHDWSYDRLLYLRLPGMAIDIPALDTALTSSDVRRSWMSLKSSLSDPATGATNAVSPAILLVTPHKDIRLMSPRPSLRSRLILSLGTDHSNRHQDDMDIEAKAASRAAAWIILDEEELEHRRGEKEWFGGVVERFERERRAVCKDSGLI